MSPPIRSTIGIFVVAYILSHHVAVLPDQHVRRQRVRAVLVHHFMVRIDFLLPIRPVVRDERAPLVLIFVFAHAHDFHLVASVDGLKLL